MREVHIEGRHNPVCGMRFSRLVSLFATLLTEATRAGQRSGDQLGGVGWKRWEGGRKVDGWMDGVDDDEEALVCNAKAFRGGGDEQDES